MQREVDLLNRVLEQVRNLPSLSHGVTSLLALSQSDPDLPEKTRTVVESDPALAAQILKIANSAAFSGQQIVDTVERAILRVGVKMIVGTVAQTQLQQSFEPLDSVTSALWIANVYGANLALNLASSAKVGVQPETAYTYGLLHDVGRLVLVRMVGPAMKELIDEAPSLRTELCKRERRLYGVDHAVAGRLLGNRWKLPPDMTLVVAAHHLPADERKAYPAHLNRIIDLLALCDELVDLALARDERWDDVFAELPARLEDPALAAIVAAFGLQRGRLEDALRATAEAVDRQRQVLGLGAR
ncbi:MAG TPA: HDOD domain-containing protein [Planctomycetota bacterium]|nr:HDOD domain-containing protein [Planctomycetota bacterium]